MSVFTIDQNTMDKIKINNVSFKINSVEVKLGDVIERNDIILVTALDGYILMSKQTNFRGSAGQTYLFTDSPSLKTTTYKVVASAISSFNTKTSEVIDYDYILTIKDIENLNENKSELFINNVKGVLNSKINHGDNLKIICASDREFKTITSGQYTGLSVYFSGRDSVGQYKYLGFNSVNSREGILVFNNSYKWNSLFCLTDEVTEVVGDNNVYLVNQDIVTRVTANRFSPTGTSNNLDYGVFILNLIELPFSIPEKIILNEVDIRLGNKSLDIKAKQLSTDKIDIYLGEIFTPLENNNFLDFSNTTVLIHLPRVPPIVLKSEYVIGHTVKINYIVDCYNGIAQINLHTTNGNFIFHTSSVDIGVNIPYINVNGKTTVENSSIKIGGENGIKNPFIEVMRNKPILENGFFTVPIIDEGELKDYNGYCKISEINISTKASSFELGLISSIISSGIIIK